MKKKLLLALLLAVVFIAGWLIPSPVYRFYHGISKSEIGKSVLLVRDTAGMIYPGGFVYEGTVNALTRLPEGYGVMKNSDTTYSGSWRDGNIIYGSMNEGGNQYQGTFDSRRNFSGFGIMRYSPVRTDSMLLQGAEPGKITTTYIGNWKAGLPDGLGREVMADSTMRFGMFEGGKLAALAGDKYQIGSSVYGIDVSHFQRNIDWDQLALYCDSLGHVYRATPPSKRYMQPVLFTFIKASEGKSLRDPSYGTNALMAKRHGIPHGAYHFLRLNANAQEQIDNFCNAVVSVLPGDLPPVLDIEREDEIKKYGVKQFLETTFGWLEGVEKRLGVRPMIYTTDGLLKAYISRDPRYKNYYYWIARYSSHPPLTAGWKFWQFSPSGVVGGCTGPVDLDLYHDDYSSLQLLLKK